MGPRSKHSAMHDHQLGRTDMQQLKTELLPLSADISLMGVDQVVNSFIRMSCQQPQLANMLHETKQHVTSCTRLRAVQRQALNVTVMLMSADRSADAVFKMVADMNNLVETCDAGQWHCSVLSKYLSCTATSLTWLKVVSVSIMVQERFQSSANGSN